MGNARTKPAATVRTMAATLRGRLLAEDTGMLTHLRNARDWGCRGPWPNGPDAEEVDAELLRWMGHYASHPRERTVDDPAPGPVCVRRPRFRRDHVSTGDHRTPVLGWDACDGEPDGSARPDPWPDRSPDLPTLSGERLSQKIWSNADQPELTKSIMGEGLLHRVVHDLVRAPCGSWGHASGTMAAAVLLSQERQTHIWQRRTTSSTPLHTLARHWTQPNAADVWDMLIMRLEFGTGDGIAEVLHAATGPNAMGWTVRDLWTLGSGTDKGAATAGQRAGREWMERFAELEEMAYRKIATRPETVADERYQRANAS